MYNSSIEDIMIDKGFDKENKKGSPLKVIVLIFIILLIIAGGAYWYFTNANKPTNKELFFQGILNSNLNFFVKYETYEEIAKKFSNTSFEMNNEITFSTTITNKELEQQEIEKVEDYSKYLLNWTTINNVDNKECFNELDILYSDNHFLNVKLINNENDLAIVSDEIVNKYVGIHKNNIRPFLEKMGTETNLVDTYDELKNQVSVEKMDLDNETKQGKIDEYKNLLLSKLPEEIFTKQENQISLVKQNSQEINVEAYKLSLTQVEVNNIIKDLLTNFKNDEEFIKRIVTNKAKSKEDNEVETLGLQQILINILFSTKIDTTVGEVQEAIDNIIKELSNEGNGLEITVYVSELGTEKISAVLPDESTIEIELNSKSETEKDTIITYLYEEEIVNYGEDNVAVYSATENTLPKESQSITEKQTNGFKLELSKSQSDANTTVKAICNIIEDEEINQKVVIDVSTKGIATSKNFYNDCVITYSNNNGEFKVNLKNEINFDKVSEIEKLTDENCLYLDTLSDEELALTTAAIVAKIQNVYENKKENLHFINTNTQSPNITPNNTNREELRNLLVNTVSIQMGEAIARGEEYNLQSLQNLQIQGHIVNVTLENDVAEVSVDGVKFRIDSNFNLSDAE